VVYRDVTRQAKGLYRLKHAGALRNGLAYLSWYNSGWFYHRSYPPQPDIPRPDHLRPSTAAKVKKSQAAEALPGGETTESGSPLAERGTEGKAKKDNSPASSVELAEALPVVPRGRRVVRKRKAHVAEPPRYEVVVL
jgi:hypothetical protein